MSDELKAASESVSWIEHNRHTSAQWDLDAFQEFYERDIDALLPLAKSYLADLAAREAEERERALPIDEEWLLSLGFEYIRSHIGEDYSDDMKLGQLCIWDDSYGNWLMQDADWFEMNTRGHILDLMRVTETKAKGGAA